MKTIQLTTGNSIQVFPELQKIYADFEPLSAALLSEALRPGDVFVDVGANVGFFSAMASVLVGDRGRVYSIEANSFLLDVLRSNVGGTNASIVNSAVGNRCGTTEFYLTEDTVNSGIAPSPFVQAQEKISVRMTTLDSMIEEGIFEEGRVDFLKIDVQGDEVAVLEGASDLVLGNENLKILVEWAPKWMEVAGYAFHRLPDLLRAYGFTEIQVVDEYLKRRMTLPEMEGEFLADSTGRRFCNLFASR